MKVNSAWWTSRRIFFYSLKITEEFHCLPPCLLKNSFQIIITNLYYELPPLSDVYHFVSQSCSLLPIFPCLIHAEHSQRYKTTNCDSHRAKTIPHKQTILYCLFLISRLVSFQNVFYLCVASICSTGISERYWLHTAALQPPQKCSYCVMKTNTNLKFTCIPGVASNC